MIPNPNKSNTRNEMAEGADANDEKLLILPLNDKNSKKISQVISSDTARNILEALASTPRSASEIAEKLDIPLTTVQYNLEKLYDAGLVKVERTKYSRKMKTVKIYAPQRKFVVIAPGKADKKDVIAALKRYLTVIVFAVFGSAAIEVLMMKLKTPEWEEATRGIADQEAPAPMYAPTLTPSPEKALDTGFGFDIFAHPGLWFLFGALFVILVVFIIEYHGRKKERKE
ncbi:MAG TPA: helix-turn-helix domain-containing protein [Candidatus Bathyarchaeia archaeon]|nr:helix-turn-helix domain-containing protein [Candidatus Bathyarchaeia archaeon]